MASTPRDQNGIPVMSALSNADGSTILPVKCSTAHALSVSNGIGGSDLTGDDAPRDENRVPIFMAVSAVDGITPVPIYLDSATQGLLIRST